MSECLSNVRNYSNRENSAVIYNANTASFTYDLCVPDNIKLIILDMSDLKPGETITSVDIVVTDKAGAQVLYTGAIDTVLDVSTLDDLTTWRIDYTITTASATVDSKRVFFDPFNDPDTRGTSDPNRPPLREKNSVLATGLTPANCFLHTQAIAATTWVVAHNTGNGQPCGYHIQNLAATSMLMGSVITIDANTVHVIFSIPLAGTIKLTF